MLVHAGVLYKLLLTTAINRLIGRCTYIVHRIRNGVQQQIILVIFVLHRTRRPSVIIRHVGINAGSTGTPSISAKDSLFCYKYRLIRYINRLVVIHNKQTHEQPVYVIYARV
jgi:hypothetical protein